MDRNAREFGNAIRRETDREKNRGRTGCFSAANAVTFFRIPCAIALLFVGFASPAFLPLYLAAGVSDLLDGPLARRTGTESEFGAKLDSAADLIFVLCAFFTVLPALRLPWWIWLWTGLIAAGKIRNLIETLAQHRRFAPLHTAANKLTGLLLFALPLALPLPGFTVLAAAVCAAASWAALEESGLLSNGKKPKKPLDSDAAS